MSNRNLILDYIKRKYSIDEDYLTNTEDVMLTGEIFEDWKQRIVGPNRAVISRLNIKYPVSNQDAVFNYLPWNFNSMTYNPLYLSRHMNAPVSYTGALSSILTGAVLWYPNIGMNNIANSKRLIYTSILNSYNDRNNFFIKYPYINQYAVNYMTNDGKYTDYYQFENLLEYSRFKNIETMNELDRTLINKVVPYYENGDNPIELAATNSINSIKDSNFFLDINLPNLLPNFTTNDYINRVSTDTKYIELCKKLNNTYRSLFIDDTISYKTLKESDPSEFLNKPWLPWVFLLNIYDEFNLNTELTEYESLADFKNVLNELRTNALNNRTRIKTRIAAATNLDKQVQHINNDIYLRPITTERFNITYSQYFSNLPHVDFTEEPTMNITYYEPIKHLLDFSTTLIYNDLNYYRYDSTTLLKAIDAYKPKKLNNDGSIETSTSNNDALIYGAFCEPLNYRYNKRRILDNFMLSTVIDAPSDQSYTTNGIQEEYVKYVNLDNTEEIRYYDFNGGRGHEIYTHLSRPAYEAVEYDKQGEDISYSNGFYIPKPLLLDIIDLVERIAEIGSETV